MAGRIMAERVARLVFRRLALRRLACRRLACRRLVSRRPSTQCPGFRNPDLRRNRAILALSLLLTALLLAPGSAEAKVDLEAAARHYLDAHLQELGLRNGDIHEARVANQVVSRHTGTTHLYLQQQYKGIDIHNALLNLNLSPQGRVISTGNRFVSNLANAVQPSQIRLTPLQAVQRAAAILDLGTPQALEVLSAALQAQRTTLMTDGGISHRPVTAKLVYQPLASGAVRLAWDLEIDSRNSQHWWSVRIDAETGLLLDKNDYVARDSYEVYPLPVESPHHTEPLPPVDARITEIDPSLNSAASPFGWHDTDGDIDPDFTITRGNNVHAYADRDANNAPDTGADAEPDGGATLDFTGSLVPMDLNNEPNTFVEASIANLFYWNNVLHDVLWEYGFDEAAGNFQVNNYGNGGLGGDEVRAEGQDGAGNCGANFGTPPDGNQPRAQNFVCSIATPSRDGDLDHGVVVHEYGHGLSNRLTGGPNNTSCLSNMEQMGEGWSDYLGLIFTLEAGDAAADPRTIGTYFFGQGSDGPGIRLAPYSTDFGINDSTYADLPGVPIPHGVGFVWATMLWDLTWELIAQHGLNPDIYGDWSTGGNNLALQLIIDGMKFQPCSPGFVDGRDAILTADDVLTGDGSPSSGANQCTIWQAFARRGLGFGASQGTSNSSTDGTADFTLPPSCDTIDLSPNSIQICVTAPAEINVSIGGFFTDPPVTFETSGKPSGTTVTFDPASVPGPLPSNTTMTVAPGAEDEGIPQYFTVTATDTVANSAEAEFSFFVAAFVPPEPGIPSLPIPEATDQSITPTLRWILEPRATSYRIEMDDNPGFSSLDYVANNITGSLHIVETELEYDTTYYWRVPSFNACGTFGADFDSSSFTTEAFPGACPSGLEAEVHFDDDLEGGAAGWTSSGTGNTWALSSARVTSGTNAFFAVDSPLTTDQRLISPAITLPAAGTLQTLQFQTYQAFAPPHPDGRCFDAGVLEISTDGGNSWSQVPGEALLTDPYDSALWNDNSGNNPIADDYGAAEAWCDDLQPYRPSVVDISPWAGETIHFAWRLGSDGATGGEGWYLDDIKVQSCVTPPFFADGFESGDTSAWSLTFP